MGTFVKVLFLVVGGLSFGSSYASSLVYNEQISFNLSSIFHRTPKIQVYQSRGQVYLVGSDVVAKRQTLKALVDWIGQEVPSGIDYNQDINITNLVYFKLESYKANLQYSGFTHALNCHGTTLVLQKHLKQKRFVGASEMNFYLSTNCQEVSAPEPGAVAVNYAGSEIFHSYTVISKDLAIEKKSVDRADPVRLVRVPKPSPDTRYFMCGQSPKELVCNQLDTFQLELAIETIEQAAYEIGIQGQNIQSRKALLAEALQTQMQLDEVNLATSLCVEKLHVKLDSLIQFLESIQGMAIFRKTDALIARESPL